MFKKLLMAGVALAAAPAFAGPIADGSFENQGGAFLSGGPGYCYFTINASGSNGQCPGTGPWTGTSGLQRETNTAWPGQPSPSGSYYGFVQGGGTLQQQFTLTTAGKFDLSWIDAGRPATGCCNGDQSYTLTVGGFTSSTYSTASGQPFGATRSTGPFVLGPGTYTLSFNGLSTSDNTAFIDAVTMSAVPEPAAWAMMIAGFGVVGGTMRRRRRVAGATFA